MRRRSLLAVSVVVLALGLSPGVAHAEFGIAPANFVANMVDSVGDPEDRAGAHPDRLQLSLDFNKTEDGSVDGNLQDLTVVLPRGMIGDPTATVVCPRESLTLANQNSCPPESQVGEIDVRIAGLTLNGVPIYNVEPRSGNLAEFGFEAFVFVGYLVAQLSPDGQSFIMDLSGAVQDVPLTGLDLKLWGVPADHQTSGAAPRRSFLTAPTRCDITPTVSAKMRSWQEPDVWKSVSTEMSPLVGCESLSFNPSVGLGLESTASDTPTGAEVDLVMPQSDDPDGQAADRIRNVDLELPEGMALSPSATNGLTACREEAVGLGSAGSASCPASSRIGTVELRTPLLDDLVTGRLYMGEQLPGTDYRLFAVASTGGVEIKVPISLHADPETGRLSTRLLDLPAVPFDRMTLRFAGGSRAPLVNPQSCGTVVASATFTPYGGGAPVTSSDAVAISSAPFGGACSATLPFAPSFVAGASRARARVASPFAVTIRRRDGEQSLHRFSTTLPRGVSARIGSVEQCSSAAIAASNCPSASKVGSVIAEAGSGPNPALMRGEVFLTGPYRSLRPYQPSPFGLAIVIRALAGPFDLGTITVRAALRLDSRTGQVTIDSDPLPRFLRGIPVQMQTLAIDIDRPGFIRNPTSCAPTRVTAAIESRGGAVAQSESRFAVGGCRTLRFRPAFTMALTDRSELHAGGRPSLRMRIRPTPGGANMRRMTVAMPKLLGASVIGPAGICSLEQAEDGRCPAEARIGSASGRTPMLSTPLRGSVYSVQPARGIVPEVWALMEGMGVSLNIRMRIVLGDDGQIHAKLVDLPDMALSAFTIKLTGGEHGLFSATRSPCAHGRARRMVSKASLTAHSGVTRSLKARVRVVPGC